MHLHLDQPRAEVGLGPQVGGQFQTGNVALVLAFPSERFDVIPVDIPEQDVETVARDQRRQRRAP